MPIFADAEHARISRQRNFQLLDAEMAPSSTKQYIARVNGVESIHFDPGVSFSFFSPVVAFGSGRHSAPIHMRRTGDFSQPSHFGRVPFNQQLIDAIEMNM